MDGCSVILILFGDFFLLFFVGFLFGCFKKNQVVLDEYFLEISSELTAVPLELCRDLAGKIGQGLWLQLACFHGQRVTWPCRQVATDRTS